MKPYGEDPNPQFSVIHPDCQIHPSVIFVGWNNIIRGARIGARCLIDSYVQIDGATIGKFTRVSSHSYICPRVTIGDHCFIGHGVMTTNDDFRFPEKYDQIAEMGAAWASKETKIGNCVRIGSGAVLLPGIIIGDHAVIAAGAVVTHDVPENAVVKGVPAR